MPKLISIVMGLGFIMFLVISINSTISRIEVNKLQKIQINEERDLLKKTTKLYEEQKKNTELSNAFYEKLNEIIKENEKNDKNKY